MNWVLMRGVIVDNGVSMYNTDDRKRLPPEPHKLRKAGCSAVHVLHERYILKQIE